MEGAQRRDINELLTHGFFKTGRGKSPSSNPAPAPTNTPSFLNAAEYDIPRDRSRHRDPIIRPYGPPPPRPIVEDEAISIARESSKSPVPCYDPPLRGIVDQNPIILEAEVTPAEAARLQTEPFPKETDGNPERRFVLIPKKDGELEQKEGTKTGRPARPVSEKAPTRPPINKPGSRQDLPSLETKVPRDSPPQFRRSASAYASPPKDEIETQKTGAPRTPSGEYFLSPEAIRGGKEYFSQSAPRFQGQESFGGRATQDKRSSGGSFSGSRSGTPASDKRDSGNFETTGRPRGGTNEKLTRPQQLVEEVVGKRTERHASTHSDRIPTGRTSRSSNQSRRYYSSSEDDSTDSDADKRPRNTHRGYAKHENGRRRRSPSRTSKSSLDPKSSSRLNSPLPSPKISPSQIPRGDQFERAGTFPQMYESRKDISRPVSPFSSDKETSRVDRFNTTDAAPQKVRQSNTAPQPKTSTAPYPESLPIPIPDKFDAYSMGGTKRVPPPIPNVDASSSRAPPVSHWAPPPFQPPPSSNLEKPVGSFRRYSEDVHRGSIAPLPACPRTSYIRGKNDWLTLPHCPSFDICPSCFESTIAPTEFRQLFIPAPRRPPETEILCDFGSSPWYRIAWLLTIKERRRDLNLFYGLADIEANIEPCRGKHEALKQWHSIIDPKTGNPIRGFDVCYSCVKSVETLLPPIRGIFVRAQPYNSAPIHRICDLRFDSKRFVQYFDSLETTADKADYDKAPPNLRDLASLARRLALFDECQQDTDLLDRKWHIITQLPEFTVCEECFDEVVWPEQKDGKAIPSMFNKNLQRIGKASCQLYSPRMRGVFKLAVRGDDYKLLAAKARERKVRETSFKSNVAEMKRRSVIMGSDAVDREIGRLEDEWKRWE